ncbi:MAG: hypothetical protein KBS62_00210 [Oscillospiraceae bacterium]|nr:hypothetical protein [Candidatus Ruminococcus equi]
MKNTKSSFNAEIIKSKTENYSPNSLLVEYCRHAELTYYYDHFFNIVIVTAFGNFQISGDWKIIPIDENTDKIIIPLSESEVA